MCHITRGYIILSTGPDIKKRYYWIKITVWAGHNFPSDFHGQSKNRHVIPLFELWLVDTQAQQPTRVEYEQDERNKDFDLLSLSPSFKKPLDVVSLITCPWVFL